MIKFKKMIKIFLVFIALHVTPLIHAVSIDRDLTIEFTEDEKIWMKEHPVIRFTGDPNWLPFEAFDNEGNYIGIIADHLKLIELNLPIDFKRIESSSWEESLTLANSKKVDMLSETRDSKLKNELLFTKTYFKNPIVIFTNNKHDFIYDITQLHEKKVAIVSQYGYVEKIKKLHTKLDYVYFDTVENALIALASDQVDALFSTLSSGSYYKYRLGIDNIKISGKTDIEMELTFAIRKDYAVLVEILNKTFLQITQKQQQSIVHNWAKIETINKINYPVVYRLIFVAISIIFIILYLNIRLKKLVISKTKELSKLLDIYDTNIITIKLDISGIITYASKAFMKISGYNKEELIGKHYKLICHENMINEEHMNIWTTIKSGSTWRGENKNIMKNGDIFWSFSTFSPDFDKNNNIVGFTSIKENITSKKNLEILSANLEKTIDQRTLELSQIKERFELTVDGSGDALWQLETKTKKLWISNQIYKLLGYEENEIKVTYDYWRNSIIYPADKKKALERLNKSIDNNMQYNSIHRLLKKSGDYIWVRVKAKSTYNNEKTELISGSVSDLTELKEAELNAEKATLAKSIFLANMSHEIRTPMNAVVGFTELLSETKITAKQKSYIKSIKSGADGLLTIINDILDLSKIEFGKFHLEYQNIDLREQLSEIVAMLTNNIKKKNLKFIVDFEDNVPNMFILDGVRLRQILLNMISNAIKFTEIGHIKVLVQCDRVVTLKDKETVNLYIHVEDTGMGVKKNQKDKIFEAFAQQDNQSNQKYGGTGLGLAISQKLAVMMNGSITLVSKVNKGSIFTLNINNVELGKDISAPKVELKQNIEPEVSNEYLLDKSSKFASEILNALETKVAKQYEITRHGGSFEDIKKFSTMLQLIAKEYKYSKLEKYARNINNSVVIFDTEEIEKLMSKYKDIIQNIRNIVNEK